MERIKGSGEDLSELLTILVNQTEKTNVCLERLAFRLSAVDAPTAELAEAFGQVLGRVDRLEGLAKDMLAELRVVSLYATQMTKRFERDLAELRARLPQPPPPPKDP